MTRFRVLIASAAEADLDEAYQYIARDSPPNAARWRVGLLEAAERLRSFPRRCRLAPENGAFGLELRQLIHGRYRLIFTIREHAVVILHIRHGARRRMRRGEMRPPT